MKTTIAILAFAALAALQVLAGDDVQVTYRGRLRQIGAETLEGTADMVFRLYAGKDDTQASWTKTLEGIPLDGDGLFQVALSGDGLAEAIDGGKANWIGVTILTGQPTPREQYPRQALLAGPSASKAARADALVGSPSIGTASVGTAEAETLSAGSLSVGGTVAFPSSSTPATMSVRLGEDGDWAGKAIPVKGATRFFHPAGPSVSGTATYSKTSGCTFLEAPCNCAVLFESSETNRIMPGMTLFFKEGEAIALPGGLDGLDGASVSFSVYPIGVD